MTTERLVNKNFADYQSKLGAYREALKGNNLKDSERALNALKDAEKEYAKVKKNLVFHNLSDKENPMYEAILMNKYGVVSHKIIRENGSVVDVQEEMKNRKIDLLEFAEYCKMSTMWGYEVEKFGQILAIMVAKDTSGNPKKDERIERIKTSYFMKEQARRIELGETPTSISSLTKLLQRIVNGIYFVDNGNGQNTVRVFSKDAHFVLKAFTQYDKNETGVLRLAKAQTLRYILGDMLHNILTNKAYGLDFRVSKEAVSEPLKPEVPEVSEPSEDSEEPELPEGYGSEETSEESAE